MELPENKLDKEKILKLISDLKENPDDKYELLTDLGIASVGAAAAGVTAAAAGSSTGAAIAAGAIPSISTLMGYGSALAGFGIAAKVSIGTAVSGAAAPVGLVAGAAVVGGAAAYGVTQMVRFKARQQGRREQMIRQLEEMLRDMSYQETIAQTSEEDKNKFIFYLEEPLRLKLMSAEDASDLIQLVEKGQVSLLEAYRLVQDILNEFRSEQHGNPKVLMPQLTQGFGRQVG